MVAAAAARPVPIPVYAEMSSINPVFVLPGALADRGAELGAAYVASMNTGVGQLCTSPGLVFLVDGPGADDFVDAAAEAVSSSSAAPMLYAGLAAAFAEGVGRLVENRNVTVAARGIDDTSVAYQGLPGLFVTTAENFLADHDIQDEVFGPASVIVRVADVDQLGAIVDRLEGQLTATIHATPADYADAGPLIDGSNCWPAGSCSTAGRPASRSGTPWCTADRSPPRRPRPPPRSAPARSNASCARSPTRTSRKNCCPPSCAPTTRGHLPPNRRPVQQP